MPLPLPNLDDRTYDDLLQDAIAQIPVEYPAWTDHNPSDTGIILLELFAWLTEMTLYRGNQIPDRNVEQFLSLLKGEAWLLTVPSGMAREQALHQEIRETILQLRQRYRAVTLDDYEHLILHDWNESLEGHQKEFTIRRVQCLPQRNLSPGHADSEPAPGHISLVVVPGPLNDQANSDLRQKLRDWLEPRRLLTTHPHVVYPTYIQVWLKAEIYLVDGSQPSLVHADILKALKLFFHPTDSGPYWQGRGWPFGRSVYVSELYQLLNEIPNVNHVDTLVLHSNTGQATTQLTTDTSTDGNTISVESANDFALGDLIQIEANEPYEVMNVVGSRMELNRAPDGEYQLGTTVVNLSQVSLADNELVQIDWANCQLEMQEWNLNGWRPV